MLITRQELSKRWKTSPRFISDIPIGKLPRIDISGGGKRGTYRYRIEDVEAYELRYLHGLEKEGSDS